MFRNCVTLLLNYCTLLTDPLVQVNPNIYSGVFNGWKTIAKAEGLGGLFTGWLPTALGYSLQGLCKFGFY